LRGRILPVGGLKEKILAAHRGGIKKVIIPKENKKDIKEIPRSILKQIKIILAEHMDDVLANALILNEGDTLFKEDDISYQIMPEKTLEKPEGRPALI
ncbi:MAG: S16 family serine protease, partial [Thermodesulfobacteriota bacterium]|nr:S16 family serine protease [Thermodesulfobacteriota bacterium]